MKKLILLFVLCLTSVLSEIYHNVITTMICTIQEKWLSMIRSLTCVISNTRLNMHPQMIGQTGNQSGIAVIQDIL